MSIVVVYLIQYVTVCARDTMALMLTANWLHITYNFLSFTVGELVKLGLLRWWSFSRTHARCMLVLHVLR